MTKKICISGYYGFDNFGDEIILRILVDNIRKCCNDVEITVFSANPEKTAEELSVNSVYTFDIKAVIKNISKCNCLISGGGSLLQDVTSKKSLIYYLIVLFFAQLYNKKNIIFAQGIGPINNILLKKITAKILKKATFVSVRDIKSLELLKSWNINAVLCNDPVWNLLIENTSKSDKVGIQLREYPCLTTNFLKNLASLINKYYSNKEINILSLQNKIDFGICEEFKQMLLAINPHFNIRIIENNSNKQVVEDISSLSELIAMRYHACLIGIKSGVKVLPLSYDIKVETLAQDFGLEYIDLKSENIENSKFERFVNNTIKYDSEKINKMYYDFETMLSEI